MIKYESKNISTQGDDSFLFYICRMRITIQIMQTTIQINHCHRNKLKRFI